MNAATINPVWEGAPRAPLPMDDVQRKVLLDLFVSPWTLLPAVGGLSAWMLSWGMGGDPTLNLIGLAGVLIGAGVQASRLIFGVEALTERAHGYLTEKERAQREARLDDLARRLAQDDDPRNDLCLTRLRALYDSLADGAPRSATAITIRENVERLFEASVRQLERSLALWEKARRLPAAVRVPLLRERNAAIDEVVLTVDHVTRTVAKYHSFQAAESDHDLAKLRKELDATLEVARRADERMQELESAPEYDEKALQ